MEKENISTTLVAIIGSGLSGISQALRLQEQFGDNADYIIFEKETTFGGVWRDSKWPTAGVDVKSHLYSIYSEPKYDWKDGWASREEIFEYIQSVVESNNIKDKFRFNYQYVGSEWNQDSQTHTLHFVDSKTSQNLPDIEAKFIVSAVGPLSTPNLPNIPGLESFEGIKFHSSKWQEQTEFEGKRVAVIGNGSSGIQIVPGLSTVPDIKLFHYIRSPGYFVPKINYKYSDLTKLAFKYIPLYQRFYRFYLFIMHDSRIFARQTNLFGSYLRKKNEKKLIQYLKNTAPSKYHSALVPNYILGCKRVAYDAGWLKCLHQDNVELVNDEIVQVNKTGLVIKTKNGDLVHNDLDIIILATGFKVIQEGVGYNKNVRGEDGLELKDHWDSLGGPEAFLGVSVPKFPNYFIVLGPNSTATAGWGFTLGNQTSYISRLIKGAVDRDLGGIYPSYKSHKRWNSVTQKRLKNSVSASPTCQNWHRTSAGKIVALFPGSATELWWRTRSIDWKNDWALAYNPKLELEKPAKTKTDWHAFATRVGLLSLASVAAYVSLDSFNQFLFYFN